VRITAQLVRTSDGAHVWSQRYDRQLTDVFAIQDEIATEVVKALQLALPPAEAARVTGKRTDDVAAYKEYLRGVALLPGRRVPDMREALAHFRKAIELDPSYARAYAQASLTLGLIGSYAGGSSEQDKALRREYLEHALKLDPGLGEAYASRGALSEEAGDFASAEENYKRAIELAPNFATGWQWYGELVAVQFGQAARGRELLTRARELDPLSPIIRTEYAISLEENGDRAGAMRELDAVLRDNPGSALAYAKRAQLLELQGDLVGELRAYDQLFALDPEAIARRGLRCDAMIAFGALEEARACIDKAHGPGSQDLAQASRRGLAMATGDYALALRLSAGLPRPDPWASVAPLLALGRAKEALALLQKLEPDMFLQPEPKLTTSYASDGIVGAAALLGAGAEAQGRDLARRTLADNATRPILQVDSGRGWTDVYGWALLGDKAKACASVREAGAAGLFTDLSRFDVDPVFASLRKEACFREALAPARARAAAQVAAARAAGLL